jgi:hypothetical protein
MPEEKLYPKVGVGVMILKNNQALLGLRKTPTEQGSTLFRADTWNIWSRLKNAAKEKLRKSAA